MPGTASKGRSKVFAIRARRSRTSLILIVSSMSLITERPVGSRRWTVPRKTRPSRAMWVRTSTGPAWERTSGTRARVWPSGSVAGSGWATPATVTSRRLPRSLSTRNQPPRRRKRSPDASGTPSPAARAASAARLDSESRSGSKTQAWIRASQVPSSVRVA